MKARAVFVKDAHFDGRIYAVEHVFMVDDRGRLWERFSDDDPGKWSEIPLPKRQQMKGRRTSKK